jgi:Phytanoyl-CoA dioxygenase (PhyH)
MNNTETVISSEFSAALPSDDDVRFYKEHGWFITPKVLSNELLDEALVGLEEHWSGHRDSNLPVEDGYANWMPGDGDGTRNNEYLSLQNKRIRKLAWHPLIGAIAARLAETSSIRLFDDQMVYKPPSESNSSVGWHVDGDYWGTCSSPNLLTAWIPLHDCPERLGPLAVIDASHKWSHQFDRSVFSFHSQDMEALRKAITDAGHSFDLKLLAMSRGQMSFHHSRTIHGSYPNRGEQPRIALALHVQDQSNRYRESFRRDGRRIQLFNDRICGKDLKGQPDYNDADVFPTLWARSRLDVDI